MLLPLHSLKKMPSTIKKSLKWKLNKHKEKQTEKPHDKRSMKRMPLKPLPKNKRLIEFKRRKQQQEQLPKPRRTPLRQREFKLRRICELLMPLKCKRKLIKRTKELKSWKDQWKRLNKKLKPKLRSSKKLELMSKLNTELRWNMKTRRRENPSSTCNSMRVKWKWLNKERQKELKPLSRSSRETKKGLLLCKLRRIRPKRCKLSNLTTSLTEASRASSLKMKLSPTQPFSMVLPKKQLLTEPGSKLNLNKWDATTPENYYNA